MTVTLSGPNDPDRVLCRVSYSDPLHLIERDFIAGERAEEIGVAPCGLVAGVGDELRHDYRPAERLRRCRQRCPIVAPAGDSAGRRAFDCRSSSMPD